MGYVYGISLVALILVVATLPVLLVVCELFPRICSRRGYAVAVWLLTILGFTILGAMAFISLANCADYPDCW
jgi:hypothetical protein